MPSAAVVSQVAEGGARSYEFHELDVNAGWNSAQRWGGRDGSPVAQLPLSITVFGGASVAPVQVIYKGVTALMETNGGVIINPVFPVITDRPVNSFNTPISRFTIEFYGAWPTNTAGVENGVFIGDTDGGLIITTANQGFGIWNNAGVLNYARRSTLGGFIQVALPGAPDLTQWCKYAIMVQNANHINPLRVSILVNDVIVFTENNDAMQLEGFLWLLGVIGVHHPIAQFLFAQLGVWMGPDSDIGA